MLCEFRVDGYTRIDHIEIDYVGPDETMCFIPAFCNPLGVDSYFTVKDDDLHWLAETLLWALGMSFNDVTTYVTFMRPDLSHVYTWRPSK